MTLTIRPIVLFIYHIQFAICVVHTLFVYPDISLLRIWLVFLSIVETAG